LFLLSCYISLIFLLITISSVSANFILDIMNTS
jgi:hypothetical protein